MKRKNIYRKEFLRTSKYPTKVTREKYTVLECRWSDFSESEQESILAEAQVLYESANPTGANTGLHRLNHKKYIDSLSGVMAEFATTKFFHKYLGLEAQRPVVTTTHNQIDISFEYKGKTYTVEVRSSFVQNGIPFALYGFNYKNQKTFFDVLGPYKQENHKQDFESVKDLFIRVLFDIKDQSTDGFQNDRKFYTDRNYFIEKYLRNDAPFYIIGGMSGYKIMQENYTKSLTPRDLAQYSSSIKAGEYHVAQISNIDDIQFFVDYYSHKAL